MIDELAALQYPPQQLRTIETKLKGARSGINASHLVRTCFLLFILACFLLVVFLIISPFLAFGAAMAALFFLRLPTLLAAYVRKRYAKTLEAELPFAIRFFAQLLRTGVTPERALQTIATGKFGAPSIEIQQVLVETKKGKSIEAALNDAAERTGSEVMRETAAVILQTLRLGVSPEACRITERLALRWAENKKREHQSFAANSNVLLVIQIFTNALLPAVLAFGMAIGGFFGKNNSHILVYLIFLVVLPLVSVVQLIYLQERAPT